MKNYKSLVVSEVLLYLCWSIQKFCFSFGQTHKDTIMDIKNIRTLYSLIGNNQMEKGILSALSNQRQQSVKLKSAIYSLSVSLNLFTKCISGLFVIALILVLSISLI